MNSAVDGLRHCEHPAEERPVLPDYPTRPLTAFTRPLTRRV